MGNEMKFAEVKIVFREIPDEVSLAISITNCPIRCPGCHSPHLWLDEGDELDDTALKRLVEKNEGITTVLFMGGDREPAKVNALAAWVKSNTDLKVGWYSGRDSLSEFIQLENFDYIKLGGYVSELGGLDSPKTNQKLFKRENG
jgi:anaerobic ribonucleoside-triphosphate reductase activating protein